MRGRWRTPMKPLTWRSATRGCCPVIRAASLVPTPPTPTRTTIIITSSATSLTVRRAARRRTDDGRMESGVRATSLCRSMTWRRRICTLVPLMSAPTTKVVCCSPPHTCQIT
ncbi:hypothetical protein AGDE_15641 [Angomonas deanei]|nr:hypothetical protein AGDE_15641 [Angomonas deanei]|eukprot:EPY18722.1 hypothetical protein AGDE_15641 [Angomonas deanei]